MSSFVKIIAGLLIFVLIGVGIYLVTVKVSQDAYSANEGFGSQSNPVPHNRTILMEDFDIRMERLIYNAESEINAMNGANPNPESGNQFVLIWVHMMCQTDHCKGRNLQLAAIDWEDKAWGEPVLVFLNTNLDSLEATNGNTISGWVVFEIPSGSQIQKLRLWYPGGPLIYAYPPTQ